MGTKSDSSKTVTSERIQIEQYAQYTHYTNIHTSPIY